MNRTVAICFAAGLWVLPVALGIGCGGDDDDGHGGHSHEGDSGHGHEPAGPDSGAKCPTGSTLTYGNFGKEFMSKYCLKCHSSKVKDTARLGAPADHNFDTIEEIELYAEHIDQKAAAGPDSVNTSMPPANPKPTEDERKKLGEWIACGVKE